MAHKMKLITFMILRISSCSQNWSSTHAPLFFGKACVPKNNLHHYAAKDDANTPSAMCSQGDNTLLYARAVRHLNF